MRFPVAALMIAIGYAGLYWGLCRIIGSYKPSNATDQLSVMSPTLATLLGLQGPKPGNDHAGGTINTPFQFGKQASGTASNNGSTPQNGGTPI